MAKLKGLLLHSREVNTDRDRLHELYHLKDLMIKEYNKKGDQARSDWAKYEGPWQTYKTIWKGKMHTLLVMIDVMRGKVREEICPDYNALDNNKRLEIDQKVSRRRKGKRIPAARAKMLEQVIDLDLDLLEGEYVDPVEDFTSATWNNGTAQSDEDSDLTITATKVAIDTLRRDADCWFYRATTLGTDNFSYDFEVYLNGATSCYTGLLMYADFVGDILDTGNTAGAFTINTGEDRLYVGSFTNGSSNGSDYAALSSSTLYYCTMERVSTTLTIYIYSDSDRTVLVDTISKSGGSVGLTATKLYAVQSYNSGNSQAFTGYIQNLDLDEGGGLPTGGYCDGTATAINAEVAADAVIYINPGTFDFAGIATLADGVQLIGPGVEYCQINIDTGEYIKIPDGASDVRISGIKINHPATATAGNGILVGTLGGTDTITDFRIDNCSFYGFGQNQSGIVVSGDCRGVIDHNYFYNNAYTSYNYGVVVYGLDTYTADKDTIKANYLGKQNNTFIEDNEFEYCRHAVASNLAAHYVFRYNLVHNHDTAPCVDVHGGGSGHEGGILAEVYGNVFRDPAGYAGCPMGFRGGMSVVYSNTTIDYTDFNIIYQTDDAGFDVHDSYEWSNVHSCDLGTQIESGSGYVAGVDYFPNTNISEAAYSWEYTAYTYPHPLITADEDEYHYGGDEAAYEYRCPSQAAYHPFTEGMIEEENDIRSMKMTVTSADGNYSGSYANDDWVADMGSDSWTDPYDVCDNDTICAYIAEAHVIMIRNITASGELVVPICNCLQEIYDPVVVTDDRGNLNSSGTVGGIYRHYNPGHSDGEKRFCCEIRLGGLQKAPFKGMQNWIDQMSIGVNSGVPGSSVLQHSINTNQLVVGTLIADMITLESTTLDDLGDGSTYGRVALTDISSGHIVLSTVTGDLDDVDDGSTYGKVRQTILGSGYIQVGSGTKDSNLSGWHISDTEIVGQNSGADQCVLNTSGQITAGAGAIKIDVNGLHIKDIDDNHSEWVRFEDSDGNLDGYIYLYTASDDIIMGSVNNLVLMSEAADINIFSGEDGGHVSLNWDTTGGTDYAVYFTEDRVYPSSNSVKLGWTSAYWGDVISKVITLSEITTPTAVGDFGKVYTKNDNKLYFQDGAGTEHEIAFA